MKTKDRNTVNCFLNGNCHELKRIVRSMAVFESEHGQSQISTEVKTLKDRLKEKKTML
jgi:hypothetical protein